MLYLPFIANDRVNKVIVSLLILGGVDLSRLNFVRAKTISKDQQPLDKL